MNRKIIHIIEMLFKLVSLGLFAWLGISLLKIVAAASNIDINNLENGYNLVALLCVFLIFIPMIIFGVFVGTLAWYFVAARLLKIPRCTLEKVIDDIAVHAPLEKSRFSQYCYKWCLDRVYKNET
jgi:membrane-anchored glycerophosphoryl diester phosphodiesterase (GDPDase)